LKGSNTLDRIGSPFSDDARDEKEDENDGNGVPDGLPCHNTSDLLCGKFVKDECRDETVDVEFDDGRKIEIPPFVQGPTCPEHQQNR
jgi:hypothetical protein